MSIRLTGMTFLMLAIAGCGARDAEYFAENPKEMREAERGCAMAGDEANEEQCTTVKEGRELYEANIKALAEEYLEDEALMKKVSKACEDKIRSGELRRQDIIFDFECAGIVAASNLRERRAAKRFIQDR